jgi:hypothetical protein
MADLATTVAKSELWRVPLLCVSRLASVFSLRRKLTPPPLRRPRQAGDEPAEPIHGVGLLVHHAVL